MFGRVIFGIAFVATAGTQALASLPGLPDLSDLTDLFFSGGVQELGAVVTVPGPIAGAGIPGLIAAGAAAYTWYRRRKSQ